MTGDLVDLMGETPQPMTAAARDDAIMQKAHGTTVMDMAEFAGWMGSAFGSASLHEALQQAAFLLCCDVIAQDKAKAALRLRERLPNGTSRIVDPSEHEIAGLLALEPNRRHTWVEFIEMIGLWGCYTSNAFAVVLRDRSGLPLEIIPLQTGRVHEKVEGRDVFYDITASTMQEQALLGASFMTVHERDMIHVRSRMTDGMNGYSTLQAGRTTLETGEAIEDFRGKLFGDEGQTRGVFQSDKEGVMSDPAFERLRTQFRVLMNNFSKNSEPVVLENGFKFQTISNKPVDMELTKQFEAQINATCRLLRVPPHKVFHTGDTKYDNLAVQDQLYVGDTLIPVCLRYEARYGKVLLTAKERLKYFFEHDRTQMAIRDPKVETERVIRAAERGLIEIDEGRAVFGWNPLPNDQGKTRTIPVNMSVVDRDGEVVIGGKAGADPAAEEPTEKPTAEPAKMLRLVANQ